MCAVVNARRIDDLQNFGFEKGNVIEYQDARLFDCFWYFSSTVARGSVLSVE